MKELLRGHRQQTVLRAGAPKEWREQEQLSEYHLWSCNFFNNVNLWRFLVFLVVYETDVWLVM